RCDCAVEAVGEGAVQCGGNSPAADAEASRVSATVRESPRGDCVEEATRIAFRGCARRCYARVEGLRPIREACRGVGRWAQGRGEAAGVFRVEAAGRL